MDQLKWYGIGQRDNEQPRDHMKRLADMTLALKEKLAWANRNGYEAHFTAFHNLTRNVRATQEALLADHPDLMDMADEAVAQ